MRPSDPSVARSEPVASSSPAPPMFPSPADEDDEAAAPHPSAICSYIPRRSSSLSRLYLSWLDSVSSRLKMFRASKSRKQENGATLFALDSFWHSAKSSSSVSITVRNSNGRGAFLSMECTSVLTIGQYSCVAYVTYRRSMSSIGMRVSSSRAEQVC